MILRLDNFIYDKLCRLGGADLRLESVEPSMPNTAQSASCAPPETIGADLLWGIKAIAKEIGLTERQAYHLAANGQIPVAKKGDRYIASRLTLRAHFGALVGNDAAP